MSAVAPDAHQRKVRMRFIVGPALLHKSPPGHNGKKRDRNKKRLCQQGMKHPNFVLDQNHPQSAKKPLQTDPRQPRTRQRS